MLFNQIAYDNPLLDIGHSLERRFWPHHAGQTDWYRLFFPENFGGVRARGGYHKKKKRIYFKFSVFNLILLKLNFKVMLSYAVCALKSLLTTPTDK